MPVFGLKAVEDMAKLLDHNNLPLCGTLPTRIESVKCEKMLLVADLQLKISHQLMTSTLSSSLSVFVSFDLFN